MTDVLDDILKEFGEIQESLRKKGYIFADPEEEDEDGCYKVMWS